MRSGRLKDRVTLLGPGTRTADGDGGFVYPFDVIVAHRIPAEVLSATARSLERIVASSVQSQASHLVTIRDRAGVTTEQRAIWHHRRGDRTLSITGVQELEPRESLVLVCVEAVD